VRLEADGAVGQVVPDGGQFHALPRERGDLQLDHRGVRTLAGDAGAQHLVHGAVQPVGVGQHDVVEVPPLFLVTGRDCSVSRYSRIEAMGVLSSCVTALMKLSCSSLRRISSTRNTV
jgi:hypothetical protein